MFLINQPCMPEYLKQELHDYPSPPSLTYAWGFGSLVGICFLAQFISGMFLAMHYIPHIEWAFNSVERIVRDVPNGWFVRCIHINGASFFFLLMYSHGARGLFYLSFLPPRGHTWASGIIVFLFAIATAFFGYVLVWGQMSFWAATVITSLITALPIGPFGQQFLFWIWGGYSVTQPTLNRLFVLHFMFPVFICFLVFLHLMQLHYSGSSTPLLTSKTVDHIRFHSSFSVKDFFFLCMVIYYFVFFFCVTPDMMVHSDNFQEANPLKTPKHIIPEWYFLPFYGLLRCVPNKTFGLILMLFAILCFFVLPYIFIKRSLPIERVGLYTKEQVKPGIFGFWTEFYSYLYREYVIFFIFIFMGLMKIGHLPFNDKVEFAGRLFIFLYFFFFLWIRVLLYKDKKRFLNFVEEIKKNSLTPSKFRRYAFNFHLVPNLPLRQKEPCYVAPYSPILTHSSRGLVFTKTFVIVPGWFYVSGFVFLKSMFLLPLYKKFELKTWWLDRCPKLLLYTTYFDLEKEKVLSYFKRPTRQFIVSFVKKNLDLGFKTVNWYKTPTRLVWLYYIGKRNNRSCYKKVSRRLSSLGPYGAIFRKSNWFEIANIKWKKKIKFYRSFLSRWKPLFTKNFFELQDLYKGRQLRKWLKKKPFLDKGYQSILSKRIHLEKQLKKRKWRNVWNNY